MIYLCAWMMSAIETSNYRMWLRELIEEKRKKNSLFSLRSLAKHLKIHPSFLSLVVNEKRHISEDLLTRICKRLKLEERDTLRMILLLRMEKSSLIDRKESLRKEIQKLSLTAPTQQDLNVIQFQAIAEWYHLPLQLLFDLDGFEWSATNAAKILGITINQVNEAIERLTTLKLIEINPAGKLTKIPGKTFIHSDFKNEALRKYNRQMMQKAILALEAQAPSERFTGFMNLALTESQLADVHQILKETMERVSAVAEQRASGKNIYHARFDFFRINPILNRKENLS